MSRLVSRPQQISAKAMVLSIISIPLTHCHLHRKQDFEPYLVFWTDLWCCSGRFVEYLLDRADVRGPWKEHTEHVFVAAMADGSLPLESFKYYLVQDYLYLVCTLLRETKGKF